jgi:glycosyltransferase involved in cell wall biosynthesis
MIIGKSPPPYFGTTVWFESLKQASWSDEFEMFWFNNNVHQSLATLGYVGLRKLWLNIKLYRTFRKFVLEHNPDVIIIPISQSTLGFFKDSVFVSIAKRKSNVLLMLHGSNWRKWFRSSNHTTRSYVKRTIRRTKGDIFLSEKIKYIFEPFFSFENIYVVPNGIDSTQSQRQERNAAFLITYLGNLQPAKGIKEIIEALVYLKEEKLELQVIGEWRDQETKEYCENIIQSNHLHVKFKGLIIGEEKIKALNNSDLFIFTPNKPEGQPLVILEAMAAGLPIISTDQGAITDCVVDQVNGFIVESNNPKQISDRVKYLMDHPEILKRMGEESRKIYEEKFTVKKMIENFENVFRSVNNLPH